MDGSTPLGAPTALTLTPGDGTVSASWTAATGGGLPITGYTASASPSGGTCTTSGLSCQLTGLTNGQSYTVTVIATNSVVTSAPSTPASTWPYPASLMNPATMSNWFNATDAASIRDAAGAQATTGAPVATWRNQGTGPNVTQAAAGSRPVLGTLSGMPALSFTSGARNLATASTTSARSIFVVANPTRTNPYAYMVSLPAQSDTSLRARTNGLIPSINVNDWSYNTGTPTLSFINGAAPGGPTPPAAPAPIVYASVAQALASGRTMSISTSFMTRGIVGQVGEVIVLTTAPSVSGRRAIEEYLARKWGGVITPAPPASATATPAAGSLAVTWTAPAWNGGSAVTSYRATASPGGASCTAASTACTITGLSNAVTYTVSVTATNSAGVGPATAAAPARPL